jgi:hypothetical protein
MIRIEDLLRIKKPIIWSMHDMRPFTGGCHYDEDCGRYKNGCGKCPVLGSSKERDLSYSVFKRKVRTYAQLPKLTPVGLSAWMTDCARNSALFSSRRIVTLPNPIDINVFKPLRKTTAREILGLPINKKLVLFGAMLATSEARKGFKELTQALRMLDVRDIELAVFGSGKTLKYTRLWFCCALSG